MAIPTGENKAAFNMALSTLESIRKWIDRISEMSITMFHNGQPIDRDEMIELKYRMVKQLIILCTPLLEEEHLKEIESFYRDIKLLRGRKGQGKTWKHNVVLYSEEVNTQLEECVMGIEKALQETGHFMPAFDDDEGLF